MVRAILKQERVVIPENVTASLKSKVVTIEGPKGTVQRSFQKVPVQMLSERNADGKIVAIIVRIWFAKSKPKSCVNTIRKHL